MNNSPNNQEKQESRLPVATEPAAKPPQEGWRRHRMLIILGLILLFIVYIFAAKEYQVVEQATPPGKIVAKKMDSDQKPLPGVLNLEPKVKPDDTAAIPAEPTPVIEPAPAPAKRHRRLSRRRRLNLKSRPYR